MEVYTVSDPQSKLNLQTLCCSTGNLDKQCTPVSTRHKKWSHIPRQKRLLCFNSLCYILAIYMLENCSSSPPCLFPYSINANAVLYPFRQYSYCMEKSASSLLFFQSINTLSHSANSDDTHTGKLWKFSSLIIPFHHHTCVAWPIQTVSLLENCTCSPPFLSSQSINKHFVFFKAKCIEAYTQHVTWHIAYLSTVHTGKLRGFFFFFFEFINKQFFQVPFKCITTFLIRLVIFKPNNADRCNNRT